MTRDPLTVVLLAEPRTGSHWLTALFQAQGFGAPGLGSASELFDRREHPFPDVRTFRQAVDWVRDAIEPCRIEGRAIVKVMFDQVEDYLAHAGLGLDRLPDLLTAAFSNPRFIRLRRLDYVAQVVSLFVARESGTFLPTDPLIEGAVPPYDLDALLSHYSTIRPHARRVFDRVEDLLQPACLCYEDLCGEPEQVGRRLSEFVGRDIRVDHPTFVVPQAEHARVKREYADRFRRDLGRL